MRSGNPFRPLRFGIALLRDVLRLRHPVRRSRTHLLAALDWLCRAQDAIGCGGVAYSCGPRGWRPPYPETTGYLVPTFYAAADHLGEPAYAARAERMAEWLLGLQMPSGAYSGGTVADPPRPEVFNTGMIVFGLVEAFRRTGRAAYREAAARAGAWLVGVQDADGAWSRHSFGDMPHAYHTRVAWALLELHAVAPEKAYLEAAVRNLGWADGLRRPNGWLPLCAFDEDSPPFTHTLAYALRGFLECGRILGDEKFVARAMRPAEELMRRFEVRHELGAAYDARWRTQGRCACLTGNAQFAHLFLRLYQVHGDPRFLNAALGLIDLVASTQDLTSRDPGIRGGIKGSHPIWGAYLPWRYPNWAAKFFADALMLEETVMGEVTKDRGLPFADRGIEPHNGSRSEIPNPKSEMVGGDAGVRVVVLTGRSRNPNAYPLAVVRGLRAGGVEVRGVIFEEATRLHLRKLLRSDSPRAMAGRLLRRLRLLTLDRWRARGGSGADEVGPSVYMRDDLKRHGTPFRSVQNHNGRRCVETLRRWRPDLVLLLGTRILRGSALDAARIGVINLHPGDLPECRGVDTVEWALFEERPLSVTAHFADRGVDTGPILLRRSVSGEGIRSIAEARERVSDLAARVAVEAVMGVRDGRLVPEPQRKGEGNRYFAMHGRLKRILEGRLGSKSAVAP